MKFSRHEIVCAQIIVLQLLLVSVGVKSVCIKEDCTDQSIKVVDPTSGQCITCFPCPQCVDGQTPSVPCGTTVPPGTDIHCVRTTPDPVVVSKASAYTTALTLLATSPSVTSLHSSLTRTKHITVVPAVKSHTHLMVVSATSSKNYNGGSSTLAVNIDFEDVEKHMGKTAKDHKMGERTIVYLCCGVTLVVIFVAILCRLRKRKTIRQIIISSQTTPMSRDPWSRSGMSHMHAGNSDVCAVRVHPETNSAKFLRSCPKGGQQVTKQGNDNEHFQHHLASPDENIVTIPSPLDVTHAEVSQQLFSSDSWIASDVDQQRSVKWSVLSQTDKYSTKIQEAPFLLQYNICLTLDIIRCDGKDVREFADKLGIKVKEFERLQQAAKIQNTTTTSIILKKEFLAQKPSGTVEDFVDIMKEMGRDDIIELIDKWKNS